MVKVRRAITLGQITTVEQLRSRQKLTPQLTEQAKRLYTAGKSLAAIGKSLGLSHTTIGKALTNNCDAGIFD